MQIKFNDFRRGINRKLSDNLLALNEARMCYNFDFSGGSLKSSFPFQPEFGDILTNIGAVEDFTGKVSVAQGGSVFYFRKYDFVSQKDASKLIYVSPSFDFFYLDIMAETPSFVSLGVTFTSSPVAINYRLDSEDVIIFCSPTDNMVVWDGVGEPEVVIDAPKITSMCLHSERLFATTSGSSDEVWFSDDLDPTNWSVSLLDAGFIQLADERGGANKVISYNGYVYIFRDRGISRLSASGAQEDFYLSHLFVSSGEIYDKTVALCGDRIIFVASDGVYCFNGTDTIKILEDMGEIINPSSDSVAEFYNGKYYLACHIDFDDEVYSDSDIQNNALFEYDIASGEYMIYRGLCVQSMTTIEDCGKHKLILLNNGSDIFLSKSNQQSDCFAGFTLAPYDFGEPAKSKVVRKVKAYLSGKGKAKVILYNPEGEESVIELQEHTNCIPIIFNGRSIGLKFHSANDVEISDIEIDVY